MPNRTSHGLWKMPLLVAILAVSARFCDVASANVAEPARALPAETVAMLRVRGLGTFWNRLKGSPLRERVEHASIPDISARFAEISNGIAAFEAQFGIDIEQTLLTVFGEDFAIAMQPDRTFVLVALGRDPDSLEFAADTIVSLEEAHGRILRQGTTTHRGVAIQSYQVVRPEAPGAPRGERHLAFHDGAVMASGSLETLKKALDAATGASPALLESDAYRRAAASIKSDALATFYADLPALSRTGALTQVLDSNLKNPAIRIWQDRFKRSLSLADCLVVNVLADEKSWTISTTLAYDESRMAKEMGDLIPIRSGDIGVMSLVPDKALLAIGNRSDKAALWAYALRTIGESDPAMGERLKTAAQQIASMFAGMDFEKEFLARIGEEAVFFVTPGDEAHPPTVCLGIELRDGDALPQTLRTWIGTVATMNQMDAEKKGQKPLFAVARSSYNGVDITTLQVLSGRFAGLVSPSVAVVGRYMLVASSDEAIRQAADATAGSRASPPSLPAEVSIFGRGYLDVRGLRALLQRHQVFLVNQSVRQGKAEEKARTDLRNLDYVLSFFDRAEFWAVRRPGAIERTAAIRLDLE